MTLRGRVWCEEVINFNGSVDRGSVSILVQVGCLVVMKVGWRGRRKRGAIFG